MIHICNLLVLESVSGVGRDCFGICRAALLVGCLVFNSLVLLIRLYLSLVNTIFFFLGCVLFNVKDKEREEKITL